MLPMTENTLLLVGALAGLVSLVANARLAAHRAALRVALAAAHADTAHWRTVAEWQQRVLTDTYHQHHPPVSA